MFYLWLIILGLIAGFCAHRGGVCLVAASMALIEKRSADGFLFIFLAMSVAFLLVVTAHFFTPMNVHFAQTLAITPLFVVGALIYGLGAGINGGCALGTLNKLFSGQLDFAGTLIGLAAGMSGFFYGLNTRVFDGPQVLMDGGAMYARVAFGLIAMMLLIFIWFGDKPLIETAPLLPSLQQLLFAPRTRGVLSIMLLGGASGLLYLSLGQSWDYSRFMRDLIESRLPGQSQGMVLIAALPTLGLVGGMALAAVLSGGYKLLPPRPAVFPIKIAGGALMGFGAGFLAGGNDTLLLYGVPSAALHAPLALGLIIGCLCALIWLMLRLKGRNASG